MEWLRYENWNLINKNWVDITRDFNILCNKIKVPPTPIDFWWFDLLLNKIKDGKKI